MHYMPVCASRVLSVSKYTSTTFFHSVLCFILIHLIHFKKSFYILPLELESFHDNKNC